MQTSIRVKEARRRRNWALLFCFAVLAALIAVFLYVNSSCFFVGEIIVEGNKYVSAEDVYRIAGIPETVNIFRLNVSSVKKRLVGDLRIADAEVFRRFPATVVLKIKERRPVAAVACAYGILEVDKQGIVLAAHKNIKQMQVPMITGVQAGNVYVGDQLKAVMLILPYLGALDESVLNQLSEVNIQSPDDILLYSANSVLIRLGNTEHLEEKASLTGSILQEMQDKKMFVEYIDLHHNAPIIRLK